MMKQTLLTCIEIAQNKGILFYESDLDKAKEYVENMLDKNELDEKINETKGVVKMNYYFITLLILYAMNLGIVLTRNGEPREDKYSFFKSLLSCLIVIGLIYLAIQTGF